MRPIPKRLSGAATLLAAFVSDPVAMHLWRELEECHTQAGAAGVTREFNEFWEYEIERNKEVPGCALRPKAVLQLALKLARPSGDGEVERP